MPTHSHCARPPRHKPGLRLQSVLLGGLLMLAARPLELAAAAFAKTPGPRTRTKPVTPLRSAPTTTAKPPAPAAATSPPGTNVARASVTGRPSMPRAASAAAAPGVTKVAAAYANLDYQPREKVEYPGNPRREVRGLYVTLHSASSSQALDAILEVVDQTAINALVIDVKDDTGLLLHRSAAGARHNPKAMAEAPVRDLAAYVERLRKRGVYTIARVVTFKDPLYAAAHPERAIVVRATGKLFRSQDKLAWGSPYDPEYRAYNLAVAREAALAGFHEVQFDYIRFPEVADDSLLDYRNPGRQTKAQAVQSFLLEARRLLAPLQVYVSADVFGLVCAARDDMRIGQYWEAVSSAVDYISPMAYPSHYAPGSYGLAVPDLHPYDLMSRAARDALARNNNIATPARVRPWIQGFTARWLPRYRPYGVPEIRAQIQALRDQGIRSYLVWNPGNRYRDQIVAFR